MLERAEEEKDRPEKKRKEAKEVKAAKKKEPNKDALVPPMVPKSEDLEPKKGTSRVWQYFFLWTPSKQHVYCRVLTEGKPCNHRFEYKTGGVCCGDVARS